MTNQRLIITIKSKSIANSFAYFWRNKIINLLADDGYIIMDLCFDIFQDYNFFYNNGILNFHGKMLHETFNLLNHNNIYVLIIDNDAYPLSREAIDITFKLAEQNGISGNLQRTNCIDNNQHLFIAPSYLCIRGSLIHELGLNAWVTNTRSDTAEEIIWNNPNINVREIGFRPLKTLFKPIWKLDGDNNVYGIGTTFISNQNVPINYHHFYSRLWISRVHFYIISMFDFIIINYKCINFFNISLCNFGYIKKIKNDIFRNLRYFLGKID